MQTTRHDVHVHIHLVDGDRHPDAELLEAYEAYQAGLRIYEAYSVDLKNGQDQDEERLWEPCRKAMDVIETVPATTRQGLWVKVWALNVCETVCAGPDDTTTTAKLYREILAGLA